MKNPYTISLQDGKSVIVYHNGKVLIRKKSTECKSIFTAWDSFVGSEDEVNAEISRLGLVDAKTTKPTIPAFTTPKRPVQASTPSEPAPVGQTQADPASEPVSQSILSKATTAVIDTVTSSVSTVWNTVTSIFTNKQE